MQRLIPGSVNLPGDKEEIGTLRAEIEKAKIAARNEALEEAAIKCDRSARAIESDGSPYLSGSSWEVATGKSCVARSLAQDIRALKVRQQR